MAATLVPAALGMNLASGLDSESPAAFAAACGASLAVAALSFPLGRALYLRHWRKVAHQELFEQKMLRCVSIFRGLDLVRFCLFPLPGDARSSRLARAPSRNSHPPSPPPLATKSPRQQSQHPTSKTKYNSVLLMQHADELDDVVAALTAAHRAGAPIDRARFRRILTDTLGSRALTAGKADFLWHLFDTDCSGFLSESEVLRRVSSDGAGAAAAHLPENGGAAGAAAAAAPGDAAAAAAARASGTVRRPPPRVARGAGA